MNANRPGGCLDKGHPTRASGAVALHGADDVCVPLRLPARGRLLCAGTRILSMGFASRGRGAAAFLYCEGQSPLRKARLRREEVSIKAWERRALLCKRLGGVE